MQGDVRSHAACDFQQRVNSELVGNLGNFVNRVLTLTGKLCGGVVPSLENGTASYDDVEIDAALENTAPAVAALIEGYHFRDALAEVMNLARAGNKYLTDTEPWKLAKVPGQQGRVDTILHVSLQVCAALAVLLNPFLPATSQKLAAWVGVPLGMGWADASHPALKLTPGAPVPTSGILFQKIEDEQVAAQVAKLGV